VHLAALWFAAPSPPFLRPRGLRCAPPSGTAVPAAPTGLDVPSGYDPCDLAASAWAARRPSWGSAPLQRSRPAGVRFARRIRPPARSALGVFHALDGLLLQRASGPFQAGAAPGVLPTEPCSSSGSRAPLGAVTLLPFLATAVLHSEVFWKITVLRSYRVLLLPTSPYPAGLPPRRRADALLGLGLSRALSGMPWPALPPAFPPALQPRRASRKTGRRLCLRAFLHDPVRGSVAGPPALLRFST
jgi:hypothetical protein